MVSDLVHEDESCASLMETLRNLALTLSSSRDAPSRFGDVVAAAEEKLRLDGEVPETREGESRSRVLAAFCDGSSIM